MDTALLWHGLTPHTSAPSQVEHVVLVDTRRPASFDTVMAAVASVAPWVTQKVTFLESDIFELHAALMESTGQHGPGVAAGGDAESSLGAQSLLQSALSDVILPAAAARSCSVISLHACGSMTDACLDVARALHAPVGAMPCCYSGRDKQVRSILSGCAAVALLIQNSSLLSEHPPSTPNKHSCDIISVHALWQ